MLTTWTGQGQVETWGLSTLKRAGGGKGLPGLCWMAWAWSSLVNTLAKPVPQMHLGVWILGKVDAGGSPGPI